MSDTLNFSEIDKRNFVKRIIRKPFNANEHFEIIQQGIDRMGDAFIKLTSAYIRNNIFGIIRQNNFFYERAIKLITDITMILKENHDQMPNEVRERFLKQLRSIEKYVDHLRQVKNDWASEFSKSNDPEFDHLAIKNDENMNALILKIEEVESLDKLLENRDVNTLKL